jgi:hypothetical protein
MMLGLSTFRAFNAQLIEHTRETSTSDQLVARITAMHAENTSITAKAASLIGAAWNAIAGGKSPSESSSEVSVDAQGAVTGSRSSVPQWLDDDDGSGVAYKSEKGNKAREALTTAREEERRLESELQKLQDNLDTNFGPDNAYRKLKGSCYSLQLNQYTYHICPFDSAKQDSTSLGYVRVCAVIAARTPMSCLSVTQCRVLSGCKLST